MSKVEIAIALAVIVSGLGAAQMRASGEEPEYLKSVAPDIKITCKSEAEGHGHNVGFIGGPDAEYYVALGDCVKRQEDVSAMTKKGEAEVLPKRVNEETYLNLGRYATGTAHNT